MNKAYFLQNGRLRETADLDSADWIDLIAPTREQEIELEKRLGLVLPTREEMEEIEISSRLYEEDGGVFMTAQLPASTEDEHSTMGPVTFVLFGKRLITIRYHDPKSFSVFTARASRTLIAGDSAETIFLGLIETLVERLADIIERAGRNVQPVSKGIFQSGAGRPKEPGQHREFLEIIGRAGDLLSDIRDSLMTLDRAVGFYAQHIVRRNTASEDVRTRLKTITRDLHSIGDHAGFLSSKITLLLDATLGLIEIEQNDIIKIFSVAAVVFLPPTLVASIYGMNFKIMPELEWGGGYPYAIGLMVISALLPYWFFKRKGWL